MKKALKWWIKERDNGQSPVYFVPCGQLTVREAKEKENTLAGSNVMHSYPTQEAYLEALKELDRQGRRVLG